MPPGTDVKVVFTAVGVQQVEGAFQRVKDGAAKAGATGAESMGGISSAMAGIASAAAGPAAALAAVAVVVGVVKAAVTTLYDMALAAREVEESIGKMADRVGGSVETLAALHVASVDNEVEMDALEKGLIKLAKAAHEAGEGSEKEKKAFQALGISMQDLQRMSPADLFVKISQRMTTLGAGTDKAALSQTLLGKAGAALVPMMNDVGAHMDEIRDKTKRLGLALSDDMVSGAMAAQGAVHQLEMIAQGLATQFDAGFMPRFAAGVTTFAQAVTGDGVTSMRTLGTVAGEVFLSITSAITKVTLHLVAMFDKLGYDLKQVKSFARDALSGDFKQLRADAGSYFEDRDEVRNSIDRKRDRKIKQIDTNNRQNLLDAQSGKFGVGSGGTSGDGSKAVSADTQKEARNKLLQALAQMNQAGADNDLAIVKAKNTAAEQDDKRRYEAGELALDDYYNRREDRINAAFDEEQRALNKKATAAAALPDSGKNPTETAELQAKKAEAIAKVATELQQATIRYQSDLSANTVEYAAAQKAMAEKNLQNEQKLATMVGDRHKASLLALQQELSAYRDLLKQQKMSDEAIKAALDEYEKRGNARINFGSLQDQATAAFGDLDRSVGKINAEAGAGAISQITATGQIISLEKERLPVLDQIITQMEAQAAISKDPAQIQAVEELRQRYDGLSISLNTVQTAETYLQNQMREFVNTDLVNFFADGISGAKSFGDAMGDLANVFEQMVARMIAKMLIYYAFAAILGWLVPGSSEAIMGALMPGGPFGGGRAGGGPVKKGTTYLTGEEGPELVTMGTDGFVIPNRKTMDILSAGSTMPALHSASTVSGSSSDSAAQTAGANLAVVAQSAAPIINITTPPGTQAQTTTRQDQGGASITDIIITTVQKGMGSGGALDRQMQSQYGLTRQGRRVG